MKTMFVIMLLSLLLLSTTVYGMSSSVSFYGSSSGYAIKYDTDFQSYIAGDGIIGGGVRAVICPKDVGFYWGSDIIFGVPTTAVVINSEMGEVALDNTTHYLFFLSLKTPVGYRWPGEDKKNGFFLGVGPSAQMAVDWTTDFSYGVGVFVEMGIQTNKTKGVGFHFGYQMGINPLIIVSNYGAVPDSFSVEATFQLGISIRRVIGRK